MAQKAAETMKITSYDLKELGVIDEVIPEVKGGAHRDIVAQAKYMDEVLMDTLNELRSLSTKQLLDLRWEKYKQIGAFTTLNN